MKEKYLFLKEISLQLELSINHYPQLYEKYIPLQIGTIESPKRDSITVITEKSTYQIHTGEDKPIWSDFLINSLYSILYIKDYIDIEELDSIFQENLTKNNLVIESILYISDNKNTLKKYSKEYTSHFIPLLAAPLKVGLEEEINIQCYIKIPFWPIIYRIPLWYLIFIWLVSLPFSIYFIIHTGNKSHEETFDITQIAENIPNSQAQILFRSFLSAPDYLLSRKEISISLWGYEKAYDGAIRTTISRLRSDLKDYPFIAIKNVHGIGYQLKINRKRK